MLTKVVFPVAALETFREVLASELESRNTYALDNILKNLLAQGSVVAASKSMARQVNYGKMHKGRSY